MKRPIYPTIPWAKQHMSPQVTQLQNTECTHTKHFTILNSCRASSLRIDLWQSLCALHLLRCQVTLPQAIPVCACVQWYLCDNCQVLIIPLTVDSTQKQLENKQRNYQHLTVDSWTQAQTGTAWGNVTRHFSKCKTHKLCQRSSLKDDALQAFASNKTLLPVNMLDPIWKHFSYGQLWPSCSQNRAG